MANLAVRLLRDDGAAVYLNGLGIVRDCLPDGAAANTYAYCTISGSDENTFLSVPVDSRLLREGTNVLAVELHQTSSTSDAGFNLGLLGIAVPSSIRPPLGIQRTRTNVVVTWMGNGFILQESSQLDGVYTNRPTATSPYTNPVTAGNRFFRLRKP